MLEFIMLIYASLAAAYYSLASRFATTIQDENSGIPAQHRGEVIELFPEEHSAEAA
jgi:hypothetical protein